MLYRLGCDIGGTFTDFAVIDEAGEVRTHKRLTTPGDPSEAIEAGLLALEADLPGYVATCEIVHGTTLVVNAIIERKGARTALLATRGTRDIIEIGRERRFDQYDIHLRFPEPLIDRALRHEVDERVHVGGRVLEPLDEGRAKDAIRAAIGQEVESIAVCLLHAFTTPAHERRLGELIAELAPGIPVSLSHEVLPEAGEYERSTTTAINAYTRPIVERYLGRLEQRLAALGCGGELRITLSTGGITSAETARLFPVRVMESGPAAGAMGAAYLATTAGLARVLAFDMGGTTAKMVLVRDGQVAVTNRFEVDRTYRFKRGSGMPVHVPIVDLIEIGAGGGSIAKVSGLGTVQVGPESASAQPGPACYGQGGRKPTVTDANLVLGYLDADYFLGGSMRLDVAAARDALRAAIADPLALSVTEAAWGIYSIVNENMASAARMYLTERGEAPESCTLVAFGGGGPLHAGDLMGRMGIAHAIVPPRAGVASAFGMLVAPMSYDIGRSVRMALAEWDAQRIATVCAEMAATALERLPRSIQPGAVTFVRSLDLRYVGQGYETNVVLPDVPPESLTAARVAELYAETYRALYGRTYDDQQIELTAVRLTASAARETSVAGHRHAGAGAPARRMRAAYCPLDRDMVDHAVYRRDELPAGFACVGPAIVEENDSTTIVRRRMRLEVDAAGNLQLFL
ncbi:MAG: hydantoinase/oxoprolinase family protein [Alphaproteobacteria bacterium]